MIDRFKGEYAFLSNFYKCEVMYGGMVFPSVENAYQAAKSKYQELRVIFQRLSSAQAKRKGRELPLRPDWDAVKVSIMLELVRDKFNGSFELKALLLSTGEEHLEEGNWWGDRFWGVCEGTGENQLGKILMQVRAEIRETL